MRSRILFLFKLILSPCANKKAKCLVSAQYLKNKRLYFDVHMYIVKTEKKKNLLLNMSFLYQPYHILHLFLYIILKLYVNSELTIKTKIILIASFQMFIPFLKIFLLILFVETSIYH